MKIYVVFLKHTDADFLDGHHPQIAYRNLQDAIQGSNNIFLDECERALYNVEVSGRTTLPMYLPDNGDGSYQMFYDNGGGLKEISTYIVSLDLM